MKTIWDILIDLAKKQSDIYKRDDYIDYLEVNQPERRHETEKDILTTEIIDDEW